MRHAKPKLVQNATGKAHLFYILSARQSKTTDRYLF